MRLSQKILIGTSNRYKFDEFEALFRAYPEVEPVPIGAIVRNAAKLGRVEQHDRNTTYIQNAIAKARLANHGAHYPVLADDSGLEVLALEGKPGISSQRYAIARAGQTQEQANILQVLSEVQGKPRDARMVCALALMIEGFLLETVAHIEGSLAEMPRGSQGFGYDSIFIPKLGNDLGLTFAEMSTDEKNALSARKKALDQLMGLIHAHGIVLAKP